MATIQINSFSEIKKAAIEFVEQMGDHRVFAFHGSMGAGKTTFIKEVCHVLGVKEEVTSPTFAIVNEYSSKFDYSIFHFDCYRLKNITEAYDIGAEEYFYSGDVCFIEWPEKIEPLLPQSTVLVEITVNEDGSRTLAIQPYQL